MKEKESELHYEYFCRKCLGVHKWGEQCPKDKPPLCEPVNEMKNP